MGPRMVCMCWMLPQGGRRGWPTACWGCGWVGDDGRQGDTETGRHGDTETRRHGDTRRNAKGQGRGGYATDAIVQLGRNTTRVSPQRHKGHKAFVPFVPLW